MGDVLDGGHAKPQFDWGEGPKIGGRRTWLFCAWLSWSRFRVVLPVWDCTLGTLVACLDTTLRRIGGAPTDILTDNARRSPSSTSPGSRSITHRWSPPAGTTAART